MNYEKKLKVLVENDIKPLGITNERVLKAFLEVPRHEFVDLKYQSEAYFDEPLPIGFGQTISQASLVALMTQSLNLKGNEKVLEIGTGSGYQAAILSKLTKKVFSVERIEELAKKAERVLKRLNFNNVVLIRGDGSNGLPQQAPFDAIVVTAGAKEIPKELIDQLKERGRIVIPVGINQFDQELLLGVKKNGKMTFKNLGEVRFVPLIREGK